MEQQLSATATIFVLSILTDRPEKTVKTQIIDAAEHGVWSGSALFSTQSKIIRQIYG